MPEIMTLKDVAEYLRINERTVAKLAGEGKIPGMKVASQWRFSREAIDGWLSSRMQAAGEAQEESPRVHLANLMRPDAVNLSLASTTKEGVLHEMTDLLAGAGVIKSGRRLFEALAERERLCSTGIGRGTAFLHPRRVIQGLVPEPVLAFGKSARGVDFDAVDGQPVHYFFLDCATSVRMHLAVLARLSRIISDDGLLERLGSAGGAQEVIEAVAAAEERIIAR